ncbi:unnamed protein product, partial [Adineta steineri]
MDQFTHPTLTTLLCEPLKIQLRVQDDEEVDLDNSTVGVAPYNMAELDLNDNDIAVLNSTKLTQTISVVIRDERCLADRIRMNRITQKNLNTHDGAVTNIRKCEQILDCQSIKISP